MFSFISNDMLALIVISFMVNSTIYLQYDLDAKFSYTAVVQYLGKKVSEPTFAFMKTRENEREFSLREGGWEIEISSTSSDLMLVSILMWIMYLAISGCLPSQGSQGKVRQFTLPLEKSGNLVTSRGKVSEF